VMLTKLRTSLMIGIASNNLTVGCKIATLRDLPRKDFYGSRG
jgi:hypothetical protein